MNVFVKQGRQGERGERGATGAQGLQVMFLIPQVADPWDVENCGSYGGVAKDSF